MGHQGEYFDHFDGRMLCPGHGSNHDPRLKQLGLICLLVFTNSGKYEILAKQSLRHFQIHEKYAVIWASIFSWNLVISIEMDEPKETEGTISPSKNPSEK